MPGLRPAPRVHAEVRPLPDLLPRAGADRRAAGRHEIELVIGEMVTEEQMRAMSEPGAEPPKADRAPRKPVAPPKKPRPKTVGMPNDAVADPHTRVRNATGARHENGTVPVGARRGNVPGDLRAG